MSDSIDEQLFHAFANLKAVLRKAEMDLGDVVKITVLVSDDTVKPLITPRWVIEYPDPEHRPARKTVVASLPEGSRVRLEALAVARNLS
jgi:enamine deaminase RidA (YjgF/YER057c/UK114 family)